MNIGNAIKEIRKRKGISQKDLAKKIGMSTNNLCSIEKEKSFPSMENIKKNMRCAGSGRIHSSPF